MTETLENVSDPRSRLRVALIWAMARNRVIGRENKLPWHLPADLGHFKSLTTGHPVIMGRKTFESLKRPLPNRANIVVSRDPGFACVGGEVAHSIDEALDIAARRAQAFDPVAFVIGGAELYRQMLPRADRLYATLVEGEFEGDAWFPTFDLEDWRETGRRHRPADDRNSHACTFLTLERRTPQS